MTAPIGVPHTFSNPAAAEWAAFICTVALDLYIGYFRELSALVAQRGSPDEMEENAILEVMARYSTESYLPPRPQATNRPQTGTVRTNSFVSQVTCRDERATRRSFGPEPAFCVRHIGPSARLLVETKSTI